MSWINKFIEYNRQTGTTTSLINLIKQNKGFLVVSNITIKQNIISKNPDIANLILTLQELKEEKYIGHKAPVYFDTDAIWVLARDLEKNSDNIPPLTIIKIKDLDEKKPSFQDLENWRKIFEDAQTDKDFNIFAHKGIEIQSVETLPLYNAIMDGYQSPTYKQQINIKLADSDVNDMQSINQDFFEGEATNSMLGRILLRKGIQFYKKLKEKF